jgi:hypothetical protein
VRRGDPRLSGAEELPRHAAAEEAEPDDRDLLSRLATFELVDATSRSADQPLGRGLREAPHGRASPPECACPPSSDNRSIER